MGKKTEKKTSRSRDKPGMSARQGEGKPLALSLMPSLSGYRTAPEEGLASDVIYAAVTRIAGALSAMPITLFRGLGPALDHPLYWLFNLRPNRRMSASAFKKALMGWVLTEGVGYAAKRLDHRGELRELEILDPRWVTPMEEEETRELWYVITRPDRAVEFIHGWYVLAFHHMTMDGVDALRPVDVLRGALAYSDDVRTFSLENVKAINRGIVLEYPTELNGEARMRSIREVFNFYKQSGGQLLALDAGVRATRMDGSPLDARLLDVEKLTRSRVATVFNLPPHLLGDYSDATAASIEQQTLEFLTLTMLPHVRQWEEELDYKILSPEMLRDGWHFRIDMEAYLRGDSAAMASRDQAAIRTGKRTVNEIRARDFLPAVPGGDVAMVSKDLAPVEMVARGATIDANQINGEQNARRDTDEGGTIE